MNDQPEWDDINRIADAKLGKWYKDSMQLFEIVGMSQSESAVCTLTVLLTATVRCLAATTLPADELTDMVSKGIKLHRERKKETAK